MNYKNILIIEAYTDANIGSGALVENSVNILRQKYPHSNIRVMSHFPEAFIRLCQVDAVPDLFFYPFGKSRIQQIFWLAWTIFWMASVYTQLLISNQRRILFFKNKVNDFLWADIVISVGAERINDKFIKNIIFSLYTYLLVKKMGKPVVLFPCTIGPFLFGWTKWLAAKVLTLVDLIYTRDDLSFKTACKVLGIDKTKVVNTSDVAVIQNQIPCEAARKIMNVDVSEKIVGISAMKWTYVANSVETEYSNYDAYVCQLAKLSDEIISRYNVTIVFYPTNYPVNGCRENDVNTARDIINKMTYKNHTHLIDVLPTPSELKGMLSCSQVNIATRMHACIFSTGALIPTISINYLFKLKEYMNALGLKEFSIDIEQFNANWGINAFDSIWRDRQKCRDILQKSIERKQQSLWTSIKALDKIANHQSIS